MIKKALSHDFIRFCLVGVLGFLINLGLLTVLYKKLHWEVFLAQVISSEVALFTNFLLHHNWTYKSHQVTKSVKNLLIQFHLSSWTAIIGSALIVTLLVKLAHINYFVALVISSVVALGWNYGWTKFVIWRHHDQKPEKVVRAGVKP